MPKQKWTSEQLNNARVIMSVGKSLGASDRDILIGIMTAWQESNLRNLNYGDRDSIGLFQQRNGWGTAAARLNAQSAARMFFLGGAQGQRGLLDFKNRDQMSLTQAAQKVQVSAFPDAYAKWEATSRAMLGELGGSAVPGDPGSVGGPTETLPGLQGVAQEVTPETLGLDPASLPPSDDGPLGLGSFSAIGLDSADQAGMNGGFDSGTGLEFLPSTGEGGFDQVFPKTGVAGGSRQRVIDFAKTLLGTPYVFGGMDPSKGLDCSALLKLAFQQVGITLPRISAQQARAGNRVDISKLQAGDLVAWDNSSRNHGADHIALYIGNGQIIEAPRPGLGVRIRTLDEDDDAWGVAMDY